MKMKALNYFSDIKHRFGATLWLMHLLSFLSFLFTQLYNMDCFSLLLCEFRIVDDINSTLLFKMSERGKNESELFPTALTFFSFTHATHLLLYPFLFGIFWFTPLICFCFHSDSFSSFSFLLSFAHSRLRRKFLKMLDRRKSIEKKTVEDAMIKWRH